MLISHRKHFIYTKTFKTAGTSVESYFEKYCIPEGAYVFSHAREEYIGDEGIIGYRGGTDSKKKSGWYNHMPAFEIRERIGQSIWNEYFKFCVVRNPFDKLVSAFHFFEKQQVNHSAITKWINRIKQVLGKADQTVYENADNTVERFRRWIETGKGSSIIDRDKYLINDEICIDYFIKYENLEVGMEHVCNLLDIPFELEKIPKLKKGSRGNSLNLCDYYDEKTIRIVNKLYKFELDKFEYNAPMISKPNQQGS